jgi:hypothetical protein
MPGELLVRITLADFDHYADLMSPAMREAPDMRWRWGSLLEDLRRLRALIGERRPSAC